MTYIANIIYYIFHFRTQKTKRTTNIVYNHNMFRLRKIH